MTAENCVFCRIANGTIPSLRILDEPDLLAFLDIGPLAPGHLLLIPKRHCENILDVPEDVLGGMVRVVPKLARGVLSATGASGLNLLQNTGESSGQAVFHLHFHLIPRRDGDQLGYRWNAGAYGRGEAEAMQARMVAALADRE